MDRDVIARGRRRREVLEVLAFERERESALRNQIEIVVLEEEAPRIDRAARALLTPAEAALLDDVVGEPEYDDPPDDSEPAGEEDWETAVESEIERLEGEVEHCRARQLALKHLAAVLASPLPDVTNAEAAL